MAGNIIPTMLRLKAPINDKNGPRFGNMAAIITEIKQHILLKNRFVCASNRY